MSTGIPDWLVLYFSNFLWCVFFFSLFIDARKQWISVGREINPMLDFHQPPKESRWLPQLEMERSCLEDHVWGETLSSRLESCHLPQVLHLCLCGQLTEDNYKEGDRWAPRQWPIQPCPWGSPWSRWRGETDILSDQEPRRLECWPGWEHLHRAALFLPQRQTCRECSPSSALLFSESQPRWEFLPRATILFPGCQTWWWWSATMVSLFSWYQPHRWFPPTAAFLCPRPLCKAAMLPYNEFCWSALGLHSEPPGAATIFIPSTSWRFIWRTSRSTSILWAGPSYSNLSHDGEAQQ